MDKAIRNFRHERADFILFSRIDRQNFRLNSDDKRGRQRNITARLDFQHDLRARRGTNDRFADVCRLLCSIVAVFDVAFISQADFYKGLMN